MTRLAPWVLAAALVGAMTTAACAQTLASPLTPLREMPSKKRGPPPPAPAITVRGVRYQAVAMGRRRGLDQNGGYIAALDVVSGRELWLLKVYVTPHDPDMEEDKQDLFIAGLKLVGHGRALLVTDERGGRYRVDLRTRAVTRP